MKKNPVIWISVFIVLVLLIGACVVCANMYLDYMQYREIGAQFTNVFWVDINVQLVTFFTTLVLFFLFTYLNFLVVRNNLIGIDHSFAYLKNNAVHILASLIIAIAAALLASYTISDKVMPFLTSEWFNHGDPVFNQDMGYYVFQRPLLIAVSDTLLNFACFMVFVAALSYLLFYGKFDLAHVRDVFKRRGVIIHILSWIMVFFLTKAVTYKFVREEILYSNNDKFVGAGYVDMNVWLPYYRLAPFILLAVVIATIICVLRQRMKGALIAVVTYPITYILVTIIAGIVQTIVVSPNEMAVQQEYIQQNINYTRVAYNLENMSSVGFEVRYDLTEEDIMNNLDTIDNIRLTDFDQTLKVLNQLQSIKTYYSFSDSDIAVYDIGGTPTAVSIAAREMNVKNLDPSANNYINTKLRYTHGMGAVVNPVNTITEQGQPYFLVKDIPPVSAVGDLEITQPRIYFSEQPDNYVIVGTKDGELDELVPSGYRYDGQAGIQLNLLNRILFAAKHADFKLLVSDQINGESKILCNRNILTRVKKIAPFFTYDSDPILSITSDGRLKWLLDGYTTSKWYAYSEYTGHINYIRNTVKVVVDAYDGTVQFYVIDESDPIVRSYRRIYPTLFEEGSLPEELMERSRYPMDMFNMQAEILKRYHITDPAEFYQQKGMWAVAKEKTAENTVVDVKPYYNLMRIEGDDPELVLMLPYTLANKDNMIAWLAVRCSPAHYGEIIVYRFNQNANIYGTYQIENKIDIDPEISQDMALWERGGSSVVRGNLLVIPVESSILYVEPVYITSGVESGALPEIARIIVAYGDRVVSKPTLNEALSELFGVQRPAVNYGEDVDLTEYIQRALDSYMAVKQYSQENNWEGFGQAMQELDRNMTELRQKAERTETEEE